jgi:hypothetical protein
LALSVGAGVGGAPPPHGSVLKPATLATMYQPHYQPDPRIPGMGLAFFRADLGGHRVVGHDGILPGFDAQIFLAPDDGVGVMAFANGAKRGMHWLAPGLEGMLRRLLGVPDAVIRTDVPHRPEIWADLCGWYRLSSHPTDPARLAIGPGAEVVVRRGRLMIRSLSPVPALCRGLILHPDEDDDPYVFRVEIPWFGTGRVVFSHGPGTGTTALHLDFAPLSFRKQPATRNPRPWVNGALGALGAAAVVTAFRRRRGR